MWQLTKFSPSFCSSKFKRHIGEQEEDADLWIGYSAFHLGDYKRAMEVRWGNPAPRDWNLGCCDKAMTTGARCCVAGNSSARQLRYKCAVIRQLLWKEVWIEKKYLPMKIYFLKCCLLSDLILGSVA